MKYCLDDVCYNSTFLQLNKFFNFWGIKIWIFYWLVMILIIMRYEFIQKRIGSQLVCYILTNIIEAQYIVLILHIFIALGIIIVLLRPNYHR